MMPPASGLVALATPRIEIYRTDCYADIIPPALMQVKKGKIPGTA
jgi:hypothetical protein